MGLCPARRAGGTRGQKGRFVSAATADSSPHRGGKIDVLQLGGGAFKNRIRTQVDTSKTNWFRVGGIAEYVFRPTDSTDLAAFFKLLPSDVPVTILGVGSNLIVRDGGIDGVVIKLGRGFVGIDVNEETVTAGAGALDIHVAATAREHSISGMEFLCGIPGTIGGAVRMNGGAYGADISQILQKAEIVTRVGEIKTLTNHQLGFVYRNSALPKGAVVTRALLKGAKGNKADIAARMEEISSARETTQPVRSRTGGSTFKNPQGHKAWKLIEQAGCRGLQAGGAKVSEQHCNFLINTGDATAADIENLGEEVRKRVKDKTGITLEWEIKRIGKKA